MATGILASLDITNAATDMQLYAVPSGVTSSFTICMTNRTSSVVLVRIALTGQTNITNDEYISYDQTVYPNESYERSGLVLMTGQFVYVRASLVGVNAIIYGYEE